MSTLDFLMDGNVWQRLAAGTSHSHLRLVLKIGSFSCQDFLQNSASFQHLKYLFFGLVQENHYIDKITFIEFRNAFCQISVISGTPSSASSILDISRITEIRPNQLFFYVISSITQRFAISATTFSSTIK